MERVTHKDFIQDTHNESNFAFKAYERLKELEDKLENGSLIELPTIIELPLGKEVIHNGKACNEGYQVVYQNDRHDICINAVYQVIYRDDRLGVCINETFDKSIAEARLRYLKNEQ